jgi:hypothetical protein
VDTAARSAQAQRLAEHRTKLLASGALVMERGGARTGSAPGPANRALFTVCHGEQTLAPAFQFTSDGSSRPELRPLIAMLIADGIDGWQLWTWLTSPSSLLSGEVPHEVARTQPERAVRAAQRFAAPNAS